MTRAELANFETTATSVLRPAFAMAGVANPIAAASLFAVGMVFRALKLRSEIKQAESDAAAALAAGVRKDSFLRLPILVADPTAALIAIFVDDDRFAVSFPLIDRIFRAEIEDLGGPNPLRARNAAKVLGIVNRFALPVHVNGEPLRFSNPELQRLYGDLIAQDPPDWRRVVMEQMLMEKNRVPINVDQSALADEVLRLQLNVSSSRISNLQAAEQQKLSAAIKTLVQTELLGNAGAIKDTMKFVGQRKIDALTDAVAEATARKNILEAKPEAGRGAEEKAELAALAKKIAAMNAEKGAIQTSIA